MLEAEKVLDIESKLVSTVKLTLAMSLFMCRSSRILAFLLFLSVILVWKLNSNRVENSKLSYSKFPEEVDSFVENLIWQVVETPRG